MKHKIYAALVCVLGIFMLTGCRLARENADDTTPEDKLVGVFITTEHLDLFDFEGYLSDNFTNVKDGEIVLDGDTEKYQGRLYAELKAKTLTNEETGEIIETEEYVFPVAGISFFSATVPPKGEFESYITSVSDPAISDGHIDYKVSDEGESIVLTGTIYASPDKLSRTYYFNPVYQSADGRVYAVTGSGFMCDGGFESEGGLYSQTLDAEITSVENGKSKTDSVSVTISLSIMFATEKIAVLQMDQNSSILFEAAYAPDEMPESISVQKDTAYIIVETHKRDQAGKIKISREIYGGEAENIATYFLRKDRVCVKKWTRLVWSD